MNQQGRPLGLQISWSKTKIQTTSWLPTSTAGVLVAGNSVEIVEKFTYLGSIQDRTGGSKAEVLRSIAIARTVWRQWTVLSGAQASPQTPSFVYTRCRPNAYVLPVLLYGLWRRPSC